MTEVAVCRCALCTESYLRGELCYYIEGRYICPSCLEHFAQEYFKTSLVVL